MCIRDRLGVFGEAGSFWTKLIYAGHDNKQEWEQAQKDKFLTTGEDFKIIGNYAFTKIGDDISMVSKQRLITAYEHGGEDAVVKLIGKDYNDALKAACKQLNAEHKLFVEGKPQ